MGLGQYDSLGEYCGLSTASSVCHILVLIHVVKCTEHIMVQRNTNIQGLKALDSSMTRFNVVLKEVKCLLNLCADRFNLGHALFPG